MAKNIKYGDWVYLKSNLEFAYKVVDDTNNKYKICNLEGHILYEAKDCLLLITDPVKIQELESAWEAG